jgi:hypothetical protein
MSRMRGWWWMGNLALLSLAALAGAGCRSADSGSVGATREPPIAARPHSNGDVLQTSAVELTDGAH